MRRSISTAAKFKTPSVYSDDSVYNNYQDRFRNPNFDLDKKDFEKSNTAGNFEIKNNLISMGNDLNPKRNIDINENIFDFGVKDNRMKNNLLNNDDIYA